MTNPDHATDNDLAWMDRAACKGLTELFYPGRDDGEARTGPADAKEVCKTCPVKEPCLEYALQFRGRFDVGIWAGTTEKERRRIRRERRMT